MNSNSTARNWAKQTIQAVGLRATPARVATLLVLREATTPLSHAEVSLRLADLDIDRATVFRNLNDLASANLLRRSELGDHVWRFELIAGQEEGHASHPHFVCVDCGSVACMQGIELTHKSKAASERFGQITEILLRGYCPDCA